MNPAGTARTWKATCRTTDNIEKDTLRTWIEPRRPSRRWRQISRTGENMERTKKTLKKTERTTRKNVMRTH